MFRTSDAVATILSIPATFATIFGFQVDATAVGLLRPEHQTHPVAACAGSAVGLICYFLADAFPAAFTLFNTSMIFGFAVNLAQCWNHRFMCVNFKHLARCYRSPLRTFGSGFAAVMWIVHLVALLGFQPSSEASLCIVASTIVLLTILYPLVVRAHQTLSPDEEKVMLFAHITKRNSSKHRLHSRRPSASLMGALIAAAQVVPSGELRPRRPSAPDIGAAAATLNRTLSAGSLSLLIDATLKRGSLHQQASMTNIKVRRFSGSTRVVPSPERIANEIPVVD
ncbi:hypothetical protein Ae201684P_016374 [Aphanomyces euteiches]|uniref:Amino acid permease/ SLC12A domain-containing protein n=1 Tax=Aphanomyces euteiches TaxID=100861 RepID=A0A6G0XIJ5_9STRA|nr:hypothetical protein Ae201684_004356 [Aphanomyces euteiches]KAH9093752.1 hypothetical protein Ae201684P_016374 [Aphanomyces euteiches]KAH9136268.1 hypothetical protein AeRB84_018489 [Aphanomyces euteiches]